jgi:hypothetical protein
MDDHRFDAGAIGRAWGLNSFSYHVKKIQTQLHLKKQQQNNMGGENIMHQSTTLAHNSSCEETINNKHYQHQSPAQKPQHDTAARVRAKSPGEIGQGV